MLYVNLIGVGMMLLIAWWFWWRTPAAQASHEGKIEIRVANGSYTPAHIQVPAYQPVTLTFIRDDASPCAEMVLFPELDLQTELPVHQATMITIPPQAPGEYAFHCQMQMYRGMLSVTSLRSTHDNNQ